MSEKWTVRLLAVLVTGYVALVLTVGHLHNVWTSLAFGAVMLPIAVLVPYYEKRRKISSQPLRPHQPFGRRGQSETPTEVDENTQQIEA